MFMPVDAGVAEVVKEAIWHRAGCQKIRSSDCSPREENDRKATELK
jgi:hypothetical protein